jgi:shikimate dehydrogenase
MVDVRLGLIGDNISRSQSPRLHRLAGKLCGLDVTYDRLIPGDMGLSFDAVFERCAREGYRGINITYPYKEKVTAKVRIDDPLVRAIGAVNTVLFETEGPKGFNTDYSGFVGAYRETYGETAPGPVCMIGAGGVGKAIAFGLVALGIEDLRLVERDIPKAEGLARALRVARPGLRVTVTGSTAEAVAGAHGLVNSTPVGMVGHGGSPIGKALMRGAAWAFDAVYTPVDTLFLRDAEAAGLKVMSGYRLFFHQGVEAFRLFCGLEVDQSALRSGLMREAA